MRWRTSELWPCSALGRQSEGTCQVKAWVLREHSERWGKIKHIGDEGCVCVCVFVFKVSIPLINLLCSWDMFIKFSLRVIRSSLWPVF